MTQVTAALAGARRGQAGGAVTQVTAAIAAVHILIEVTGTSCACRLQQVEGHTTNKQGHRLLTTLASGWLLM